MTDAMETPVLFGVGMGGLAIGGGAGCSAGFVAMVSALGAAGFGCVAWDCAVWASPDLSLRLNIIHVSPEVDPRSQSNCRAAMACGRSSAPPAQRRSGYGTAALRHGRWPRSTHWAQKHGRSASL